MEYETDKLTAIGNKALDRLADYFDGKMADPNIIRDSIKITGFNIKVLHLKQLKEQGDKSLALRLLKFLPDDKAREKYIELTNPEIKPLLLGRPGKNK